MWKLWLLVGWLIWMVTIVASGAMNFLAGLEFGRTAREAYVFAALGVAADGWKALGPVFIAVLLRSGKRLVSAFAISVWVACIVVAVSAALGLAASNRNALVASRDSVHASFAALSKEVQALEARRDQTGTHRTPAEIEASIASILARPVTHRESIRGTIGSLSDSCVKIDGRTAAACSEVAELQRELAAAKAWALLDMQVASLRSKVEALRQSGGATSGDPQAHIIAKLTRGLVAKEDVGLVLILAMMGMIELVSAFAPLVLTEYGRSMMATGAQPEADVAASRDVTPLAAITTTTPAKVPPLQLQQAGGLFDYMADRVRPSGDGSVRGRDLYTDYAAWCQSGRKVPLPHKEFFEEFERICTLELNGSIHRSKTRYVGLALVDEVPSVPADR